MNIIKLKIFAFENNFIFDKRNFKFDIKFENLNKELNKKLVELRKIIQHLSITTSHTKIGTPYIIHLHSWCRIYDNTILIKN